MEPCVHRANCGGCIYQEIAYEDQLQLKAKDVIRHFNDNLVPTGDFLGIESSPSRYGYRNKMEYTFGDEVKGGELTLGLHRQGRFFSIITTDECQIADEDFNKIQRTVLDFCKAEDYPFYHKKSHKGLLRHLVLRKGHRTGELLVNIVTSTQLPFSGEKFVEVIKSIDLSGQVVGILHTENDNKADAVNCDNLNILWGRDYYNEELMGLKFSVSAFSFFQTNVEAAERLYSEAISLIPDLSGKTVFDLYSGTGTIAQAVALKANKVIGIEIVEDAVNSARRNADLNEIENCTFVCGDVLKLIEKIDEKPDVIFLDPPRAGVHPKALEKILNYGVNEIVYISCNPKTLAQNLAVATDFGYKVEKLKAYDNFPFTRHVEAVTLLTRSEASCK
ncbi:MAG TPA: 23S rRNA (uracil(1939)-C(5))-methyltransferase RlmD [Anaerovoracaceae bacterium]|nr:23S rRNA (uracil(1939)-C(5))-methyltransferase RlmD [Anaerovoracaceae bacterium]